MTGLPGRAASMSTDQRISPPESFLVTILGGFALAFFLPADTMGKTAALGAQGGESLRGPGVASRPQARAHAVPPREGARPSGARRGAPGPPPRA